MSKKPPKGPNKLNVCESDKAKLNNLKLHENSALDIVIGPSNVKRWNLMKSAFSCQSNEYFASKLLDIAQEYLEGKNGITLKPSEIQTKKLKKRRNSKGTDISCAKTDQKEESNDNLVALHKPLNSEHQQQIQVKENDNLIQTPQKQNTNGIDTALIKKEISLNFNFDNVEKKIKYVIAPDKITKASKENKKKLEDLNKTPEKEHQNEQFQNVKIEVKQEKTCTDCNTFHENQHCPLLYPNFMVSDNMDHSHWNQYYKETFDNTIVNVKHEKDSESTVLIQEEKLENSYSKLSLPDCLYLKETVADHGLGVFAKCLIQPFSQFGPLVGRNIKEVDISEESMMRDIWELAQDTGNSYITTEDFDVSNWIRFIRPAPTREERNMSTVIRDNKLYFITSKLLKEDGELLYWQDSSVATNKKRMEKTSCGGCNMMFSSPLYYRTHCSVFHDVRYSLTIRKYHCKICGEAVLGKENIMKHATELHNGQGAYQCQFCKKFFLRLNYLEMHRTYGCSANPHRSRPLCDFCGRKFCQPQKLKVHIKRMHSDMSEVLKEFQCKSCLKVLGSRAALQRHMKEVHQKQLEGGCSCLRCGKHFQNKSNLKIHMLTHSGIKPFRCATDTCNAAFTTKQCLQFHYKKVHGFTEEDMPKIERSVDYTFQAYSGADDDLDGKNENRFRNSSPVYGPDSDIDDDSLDAKSMDDPPALQSPLIIDEHSLPGNPTPPPLDTYTPLTTTKILTKGSKKWISDEPLHPIKNDLYQLDHSRLTKEDMSMQVQESDLYSRKLNSMNDYGRNHETSNASLLVEAALDSVCSEPNMDIDVGSSQNCSDLNNLYTLAQSDNLHDVTYSETVCISESRDINLISPSVHDHISVTDELNDELRHNQSMGMDYSNFHQEDFSPANSPDMQHRSSFVRNYINNLSPPHIAYNQSKNSPVPSPPRYDFGHGVTNEQLSSDDSNGMAAQNLSLHNAKNDIQLDLSIYKSPYKIESYLKKDFRMKFESDVERKIHILGIENMSKSYADSDNQLDQEQVDNLNHEMQNNLQNIDVDDKSIEDNHERSKYPDDLSTDLRNKIELDLDFRLKNYDNLDRELLTRNTAYDSDIDFRNKGYDLIDSIENRNKSYETIETDFRTDRNFEPLLLNSSELQGLDMSARSFHNYSNINRYHHIYPEVDRVDLRMNYSPPPPAYTHADILRVVSLDLTPPGRHSVDLSLRTHPLHPIANTRLLAEHTLPTTPHRLLDQPRLLTSDLSSTRHLSSDTRLLADGGSRILSDHTTNRILSTNDQLTANHLLNSETSRLLSEDTRMLADQPRLLEPSRLLSDGRILQSTTTGGAVSPVPTFPGYSVTQGPYHPTPIPARPHVTSPTPPYHHYPSYY